jgi:hypothetical protein
LLYGSVSVEFPSAFAMHESIECLKAATARSVFLSLNKQSAVGTVTEQRVSLQHAIPMVANSFKPFFIGHFEFKNGRVVLVGRFTMLWIVKAFMTFWLGFCVFWTGMAVVAVASQNGPSWWFPLAGVGMFCIGVAFVRGCQWLARDDVAWLSQLITSALSGVPPNQRFQPAGLASGSARG